MRTRSTATYDDYTQGSQVRRATLVAASLGFSVIQLDVFVVNVGTSLHCLALGPKEAVIVDTGHHAPPVTAS